MRLTVLGSSASQPSAGDACSGYLVEQGDRRVLLDCGSGVLGNLLRYTAPGGLDAIFVSHMHPDHYIDLLAMRYGLKYGSGEDGVVPAYLPPGGAAQLQRVSEAVSATQPFFAGALELREYAPDEAVTLGELAVEPFEVVHGIRSFGMRVTAGDEVLAYSSDTVACDALVEGARGADVLLAENTLGGGAPGHHDPKTHLTAIEAAEAARDAGVQALVLTHFWYTADRDLACREAGTAFSGAILIARPHLAIEVGAVAPVSTG